MKHSRILQIIVLALLCCGPSVVLAVPVELRLVVHDKPDVGVEKMERRRPIVNPVSTAQGVEMKQLGVDLACWARNVRLDGQPVFERYHEGKYIDRLSVARPDLKPGDHTLWPGNHVFKLGEDGKLTSQDPELIIDGSVVRLKCYPVTIAAYRSGADQADVPHSMRLAPVPNLTIRETDNAEQHAANPAAGRRENDKELLELLPVFEQFAPLTVWLPANQVGKGYLVHPVGLTFHLKPEGIATGTEGGWSGGGLKIEKNRVELPLLQYPVSGSSGSEAVVPTVETLKFPGDRFPLGGTQPSTWYPRREAYEFRVSDFGPAIAVEGNLERLPHKLFRVELSDPVARTQRGLAVELDADYAAPGGTITARVRAVDAGPATVASRRAIAGKQRSAKADQALNTAKSELMKAEQAAQAAKVDVEAKTKALEAAGAAEDAVAAAKKSLAVAQAKAADADKLVVTNRAALDRATPELATAKAAEPALEAAAKEADALNPLADAKPIAQLQRHGASDWHDLQVSPADEGTLKVALPADARGFYRLRLGVRVNEAETMACETWIAISQPKESGIGLFTQRGRDAFYRGESFWLGVGAIAGAAPIAASTPLEVTLVDSRGQRLTLLKHSTAQAIAGRETFIARLDEQASLGLAAGHYQVEARLGDLHALPIAIDLIDADVTTHFTNLLVGKYNTLQPDYQNLLRGSGDAEELVRGIVSLGYNAFQGMSYDVQRIGRPDDSLERLARRHPELGPSESHFTASGRDRFLNAAVRHNLRFYENLFAYNDTSMPREPHILDACERYSSLEVASMRHSPALRGVGLYDEFYDSGDSGTPQQVTALMLKAQELAYRAKHKGLTSAEATKAFDRYAGRPLAQRLVADLEKFRTWPEHQDSEWRDFSTRMSAAAKQVLPTSRNFTLQRFWGANGGNLAPNGTASDVFQNLDMAACVMYKDGGVGDRPVFAPMQADVLRTRDDLPVWTQLHNFSGPGLYGPHLVRQAFYALSQRIEGLTYFTIQVDPSHPDYLDNREAVRDIAARVTTPYGDLLMAAERGYKKIAVYYSRQADHLTGRKPNKLGYACEGLWVACSRAGFPADFLYDDQVIAAKGLEYEVIFAPGFYYEDEARPEVLAALKRLVNSGKLLVVERSSKLPIEGIVHLDSDLDEYDDKQSGAFPQYVDFESDMVWKQSEKTTKIVRDLLRLRKIAPAAEHDLLVGPDWLKCRQAEYMLLPNFADTGFSGLHKTLYQAPDRARLRFPRRPGVCYDMLEMKRLELDVDDDWMTLEADLRYVPGKIYAFLPAAIKSVALRASKQVAAGGDLDYAVAIEGEDGRPLDAGVPIEITVLNAKGEPHEHIYRAAAPSYRGVVRLPANVDAGAWTLRVKELISGAVAEARIDVKPGQLPAAKLDTRQVWLRDAGRIREFFNQSETIVIALDDEQSALEPHAARLAAGLKKQGCQVKIVRLADVLRLPVDWTPKEPVMDGARLWRGDLVAPGLFVDAPLVLLGGRHDHRLVEALVRRDLLSEPLSENFPGPGRALVNWTRRAFSNEHDTISVLATDDAGLERGIDAVLNLESTAVDDLPAQPPIIEAKPNAKAELAAAEPRERESGSLRDVASSEDWSRSLDVDPSNGRVLIGTVGYGDNLFCFATDGKLQWKTFLPDHNVYFARWYDGGQRIVAATGQGANLFLIDAKDGRVTKKLHFTEWPEYHYQEGPFNTEHPILINAAQRQILLRGLSGLLAIDFEGRKLWFHDRACAVAAYPADSEQTTAAEFNRTIALGDVALSPDGAQLVLGEYRIVGSTRKGLDIVSVWQHVPKLLSTKTGEVLWENTEEPGGQMSPGGWSINWPASGPTVHNSQFSATLTPDGKLGPLRPRRWGEATPVGRLLLPAGGMSLVNAEGRTIYEVAFGERFITGLDRVSSDGQRVYRCSADGVVLCLNVADGQILWRDQLPMAALLEPVADGLAAAGQNGLLVRWDNGGKRLWQTRLREHHEMPEGSYAKYVAAAALREPDSSGEFFPVGVDRPGEYDSICRFGIEQLIGGDFETVDGWKTAEGQTLAFTSPGHSDSKQALAIASGQLITQRLSRRVIPSSTYVLEFFYRLEDDDARLIAGGVLDVGQKETFTGSQFAGPKGQWTFGRLAIKTFAATATLDIGFEAAGGRVTLDRVSLRPLRFPSPNLLANAELHAIDPTFVADLRVQYDRIPSRLRESLMKQNRVAAFKQGQTSNAIVYTQEEAFLHNGRLDDVGERWTYSPDGMGFSVVLTQSAYVSHLVLYLNNAAPENVYSMISVLANNLETKKPELVELVRGNQRRFVIVHFDKPVFTDSIKILPGKHPGSHDCLTEVEVYGPLGGPMVAAKTFADDPLASAMFMGGPTHASEKLPVDLTGDYIEQGRMNMQWPLFAGGMTAVSGGFTFPNSSGEIFSAVLPDPAAKEQRLIQGPTWKFGTLTPTTTPARYAGRLLVGSADYRMHAVSDTGRKLWAFQAGGRVHSSPLPQGDDVYFGSDDGKLYKVDVDSGTLVWEFATGDKVRSSPALADGRVHVASYDGLLYAIDAQGGQQIWKAPLAQFTRSSPAVFQNKVFIGDEAGHMLAFDATTGAGLWNQPLEGFISTCPVVTRDAVFYASEAGNIARLGHDGSVQWKKALGARVIGQPVATATQLLVPTEAGLKVLRAADGDPDDRFRPPASMTGRAVAVLPYGNKLAVLSGTASTYQNEGRAYAKYDGYFVVLTPKPAPAEAAK